MTEYTCPCGSKLFNDIDIITEPQNVRCAGCGRRHRRRMLDDSYRVEDGGKHNSAHMDR